MEQYYMRPLIAYVRGHSIKTGTPALADKLFEPSLDALSEAQAQSIFEAGKRAALKLYKFKNTHDELPRVKRVLGFLKSIAFESLLDVGSGRGVFLLPFMEAFPWVEVTSVDILEHRVAFLNELSEGGMSALTAVQADICKPPLPEKSVDVVTLLEVLEHIPDVAAAVDAAVRLAKKFVVVSVPSKEDNNPEHIHLLTKDKLTTLFTAAGCNSLHFDGVNGHLIMIARI